MVQDGCWSTVICNGRERAALGDTSDTGWVLSCRLGLGHHGDHASDAEVIPRFDRRLWLEWNDRDQHAQSLIERNPCSAPGRCMLFEGHGGIHWFAPTNGHAPSVVGGHRQMGAPETNGHSPVVTVERIDDVAFSLGSPDLGSPDLGSPDLGPHEPSSFDRDQVPQAPQVPIHDIPNLRGRAVRTPPDVDAVRADDPPIDRTVLDTPVADVVRPGRRRAETQPASVTDALDDVVAALARLADALRAERGDDHH